MLISAPEGSDLMDPASWAITRPLAFDGVWLRDHGLPNGSAGGYLEGERRALPAALVAWATKPSAADTCYPCPSGVQTLGQVNGGKRCTVEPRLSGGGNRFPTNKTNTQTFVLPLHCCGQHSQATRWRDRMARCTYCCGCRSACRAAAVISTTRAC